MAAAISSATSSAIAAAYNPSLNTQKEKTAPDTDVANDGSRAVEAEKAATVQQLATSGSLGTRVNTTA